MNKFFVMIVAGFIVQFNVSSYARQFCSEVNDAVGGQISHLPDGSILFEEPTIQYGSQKLPIEGDVGTSFLTGTNGKAFCRLQNLELVTAESKWIIFDHGPVISIDSSGRISGTEEGSFALSKVLCRETRK